VRGATTQVHETFEREELSGTLHIFRSKKKTLFGLGKDEKLLIFSFVLKIEFLFLIGYLLNFVTLRLDVDIQLRNWELALEPLNTDVWMSQNWELKFLSNVNQHSLVLILFSSILSSTPVC
jgi:hypothetical protein